MTPGSSQWFQEELKSRHKSLTSALDLLDRQWENLHDEFKHVPIRVDYNGVTWMELNGMWQFAAEDESGKMKPYPEWPVVWRSNLLQHINEFRKETIRVLDDFLNDVNALN